MDLIKNRFFVGTSRGVLLCTGDKPNDLKVWKNDETSEVTAISNGRNLDEILLGYNSGNANIFNTEKQCFTKSITDLEGEESITGVGCIGKTLILSRKDGVVNIWTSKKNDYFSINLDEKGTLDVMVCHPNRENVIGTGGEFNDFKLWNVQTKQCIFKAKSLGHDELQLPIPTSVRGLSFFLKEPNLAACCTKEGHVLLYDDRAQRRPVVKFFEKAASYTTISPAFRDRQVIVGTTKGYMQWIDLKTSKVLKTYTTFTGSVTSIVCDPVEPFVASVSLDRHLRIHNLETKEQVYKCYMKQNLTKLFVQPVIKQELEKPIEPAQVVEDTIDEEFEEIFENMEEIQTDKKNNQKKRKVIPEAKSSKKVKKKKKALAS